MSAARWTASEALPGRERPDADEDPSGRVEAGSALIELERVGGWVRVETPQGRRLWIDGRRLVAAAPISQPPPAEPPSAVNAPPDPIAPPPPLLPEQTSPDAERTVVVGSPNNE